MSDTVIGTTNEESRHKPKHIVALSSDPARLDQFITDYKKLGVTVTTVQIADSTEQNEDATSLDGYTTISDLKGLPKMLADLGRNVDAVLIDENYGERLGAVKLVAEVKKAVTQSMASLDPFTQTAGQLIAATPFVVLSDGDRKSVV